MKTGRKILGNINYLLNDAHLFFPAKILVTQENLYELYREDLDKTEFEKILFSF